ncbi:hypothetical protein [Natronorubrum halophilum]|uniref:hypothetical protein n=1 Tax=Natronorubrum halophilum TaxID=1702106 RepID=UPI0010C241CB|nr:hypothetical protein [Natronorubrum halophilum]
MGIIERFEDEYLEVSRSRATVRELLELFAGSILFVLVASGLAYVLLDGMVALAVAGLLTVIFAITFVSQAYWSLTGRDDYTQ